LGIFGNPLGHFQGCGIVSRGMGGQQKIPRFQIWAREREEISKINIWQKFCFFSNLQSYTVLALWREINFSKAIFISFFLPVDMARILINEGYQYVIERRRREERC
jgi:hypothetical protein